MNLIDVEKIGDVFFFLKSNFIWRFKFFLLRFNFNKLNFNLILNYFKNILWIRFSIKIDIFFIEFFFNVFLRWLLLFPIWLFLFDIFVIIFNLVRIFFLIFIDLGFGILYVFWKKRILLYYHVNYFLPLKDKQKKSFLFIEYLNRYIYRLNRKLENLWKFNYLIYSIRWKFFKKRVRRFIRRTFLFIFVWGLYYRGVFLVFFYPLIMMKFNFGIMRISYKRKKFYINLYKNVRLFYYLDDWDRVTWWENYYDEFRFKLILKPTIFSKPLLNIFYWSYYRYVLSNIYCIIEAYYSFFIGIAVIKKWFFIFIRFLLLFFFIISYVFFIVLKYFFKWCLMFR